MKYMFASDVHGSAYYCRKMLDAYKEEKAERLVLLGDLLYHGPRNDLPREYAPKPPITDLVQYPSFASCLASRRLAPPLSQYRTSIFPFGKAVYPSISPYGMFTAPFT